MGNWGFIFRQLVLDRFQTLFYFVPQEKNITVKLQLVAIVSSHCRGSELAKKLFVTVLRMNVFQTGGA